LGLLGFCSANDPKCIICEHIGFAETETQAHINLLGIRHQDGTPGGALKALFLAEAGPKSAGGVDLTHQNNYCLTGLLPMKTDASAAATYSYNSGDVGHTRPLHVENIGSGTNGFSYCVAQFFVYYAQDMDKYVYGVKRFGSTANVNGGLVDLEGYDGIRAYQYSLDVGTTKSAFGRDAAGLGISGPNPIFKMRNYDYTITTAAGPPEVHTVNDPSAIASGTALTGSSASQILFMGDGREDNVATTATALTITPFQQTPYTRCLICHGTQEFQTPPAIASAITIPCWNPSGSTTYETDFEATLDPRKYCKPAHGFCKTTTWQYSTRDSAGSTSSYWVGIERGCPDHTVDSMRATHDTTGVAHTTKRGATNMKEFVRYYPATNTASKAKDNAKYPDADTGNNIPVAYMPIVDGSDTKIIPTSDWALMATKSAVEHGLLPSNSDRGQVAAMMITPQFMSADGGGKPDLPVTVIIDELECLSCVTPIGNTDAVNTCVSAKTNGRVKCKTLSCASVTANYVLGDSTDKYYYSKRGCDADPEDGKADGEQDPADEPVVPAGWTGIKQYNQRTTTKNGNTGRSSSTSTAKVFDCYSCQSSFSHQVSGPNPVEPLYDSIKTKDTSLCWETYEPQTDTSVSSTGTSGSCVGNCYSQAYKYKETSGPLANPTTTFNWYIKRGCIEDKSAMSSGSVPSKDLYGVTVTHSVCTFQNGTLCNGKIEAYDTSLELKTQNVRKLQCYTCDTPAGNTDSAHECYTVPSTAKATECDDLSYVSCYATETSFMVDGVAQYGMSRGCSKSASSSVSGSEAIDGYTNVMAVTTGCSSSSCNKVAGSTANLVEGDAVAPEVPEAPEEPAETDDGEGDDAAAADGDATDPAAPVEGGAAETMISALMLLSLAFF